QWSLLGLWIVSGGMMVAVPLWNSEGIAQLPTGVLAPIFLAVNAVVGAIFICLIFGSYLLVALSFGGHNDEVAGAARIERFKQFVRFCITPETVTAYIIGI